MMIDEKTLSVWKVLQSEVQHGYFDKRTNIEIAYIYTAYYKVIIRSLSKISTLSREN